MRKKLDEIIEQGSMEDRKRISMVFRAGYTAISDKYGSMTKYAHRNNNMNDCNNEILRRDMLLYRYVRLYGQNKEVKG